MASVLSTVRRYQERHLKRNYQFEKRQKELEKKRKKELKQQKQLERANRPDGSDEPGEAAPEDTPQDG